MKYKKVYVGMIAEIKPDGYVHPMTMIFDNDLGVNRFDIDKVVNVRKGAAMKAGGMGLRYLVKIQGHEKILWYENPAWFIELPETKYQVGAES